MIAFADGARQRKAAALLEQRRRDRGRAIRDVPTESLLAFAKHVTPAWDWDAPHLMRTAETLDALQPGARLGLEIPIRHGKSELATIRFAARAIVRDPTTRVLIGSASEKLAHKFSRAIRRMVRAAGVVLSREKESAGEWETEAGGGVRATGIGGATSGIGCDILLLDDPIANRAQAESEIERERVWDSITNDFLSRLEPHGIAIVTMSRWHLDDPIGRLRDGQAGGAWQFLRIPALAEADDPLGREEGAPLWPSRWTLEALEQRRLELGPLGFASLLQQSPQPKGGSMFRYDWWPLLEVRPEVVGPVVRYWDIAGTEPRRGRHDPDYTVGALLGRMADGRFVVLDVVRIRASIAQRDAQIRATMLEDVAKFGGRVRYVIERPTGMGGADQERALRNTLAGVSLAFESPTVDKVTRAGPLAAHAESGLVVLAPGAWRDDLRLELSAFPRGTHDDQVDALTGAFSRLALPSGRVVISELSI